MSLAAQSLIIEYLQPHRDDHILALEGGSGWLASEAARLVPDGKIISMARDIREVLAAQSLLVDIPNATAVPDVFPSTANWDIVLLTIPKERRYARALLLAAWNALKPGGKVFLAGPTKAGAKAVIKDAERLFGDAVVLGYRNHQRVAACTRGSTLPHPLPKEFQQIGIAPGTRYFIESNSPSGALKLETHPGIFSWEAIDQGTAFLLEHLEIGPGARVWDVGCGCGIIGLTAAMLGAEYVAMSDTNLLAVGYAQANATYNNLGHKVQVFPADTLTLPPPLPNTPAPSSLIFSLILSNPAFHQGRSVDKSMADQLISSASDFLAPAGRLLIVANRFLNYDKFMRGHFKFVSRIAETSKFHLIQAHNK